MRFLVAAMVLTTGCSFAFMSFPPTATAADCTEQLEAPVTDTTIAVLAAGATATAVVAASHSTGENGGQVVFFAAYTLPITLIEGISAIYGFHARSSCHELKEKALTTQRS